jgi:hypothetical protein
MKRLLILFMLLLLCVAAIATAGGRPAQERDSKPIVALPASGLCVDVMLSVPLQSAP